MFHVKLRSSGGQLYDVDQGLISLFPPLYAALLRCHIDKHGWAVVDAKIESRLLEPLIDWGNFHKTHPPRTPENFSPTADMYFWDIEFFRNHQPLLMEFLKVSKYLHCQLLHDSATTALSIYTRGRNVYQSNPMFKGPPPPM